MARVRKGEITFYNLDGEEIQKKMKTVDWDAEAAEKAGYEHFMMKEIMEQPQAISATISPRIGNDGRIILDGIALTQEELHPFSAAATLQVIVFSSFSTRWPCAS